MSNLKNLEKISTREIVIMFFTLNPTSPVYEELKTELRRRGIDPYTYPLYSHIFIYVIWFLLIGISLLSFLSYTSRINFSLFVMGMLPSFTLFFMHKVRNLGLSYFVLIIIAISGAILSVIDDAYLLALAWGGLTFLLIYKRTRIFHIRLYKNLSTRLEVNLKTIVFLIALLLLVLAPVSKVYFLVLPILLLMDFIPFTWGSIMLILMAGQHFFM